jgi:hypothetical protein
VLLSRLDLSSHLDGRLNAVPLQHGYPRDFDPNNPKTAMVSAARVKSYRGPGEWSA